MTSDSHFLPRFFLSLFILKSLKQLKQHTPSCIYIKVWETAVSFKAGT